MNDRGIIKWQPFDSVFSSKLIKEEVLGKKRKVNKPILSEEQKINIEKSLLQAYHEKIPINLTIFTNNQIYETYKRISKIIFVNQKILFDDFTYVYFDQIIDINI